MSYYYVDGTATLAPGTAVDFEMIVPSVVVAQGAVSPSLSSAWTVDAADASNFRVERGSTGSPLFFETGPENSHQSELGVTNYKFTYTLLGSSSVDVKFKFVLQSEEEVQGDVTNGRAYTYDPTLVVT